MTGFGLAAVIEASVPSEGRHLQRLRVEEDRFINPRKLVMNFVGCAGVLVLGNTATTGAGVAQYPGTTHSTIRWIAAFL